MVITIYAVGDTFGRAELLVTADIPQIGGQCSAIDNRVSGAPLPEVEVVDPGLEDIPLAQLEAANALLRERQQAADKLVSQLLSASLQVQPPYPLPPWSTFSFAAVQSCCYCCVQTQVSSHLMHSDSDFDEIWIQSWQCLLGA